MTPAEVADRLALFVAPDQVTELRAKDVGAKGRIFAGWFVGDKLHDMARHALALSRQASAVYFVPNPVDPRLAAKRLNKVLDVHRGFHLTGDSDVLERRFLIVDLDPRRCGVDAAGGELPHNGDYPSAGEELGFAVHVARAFVAPFLAGIGFGRPVEMLSGNGVHLCYRVAPLAGGQCGPTDPAATVLRLLHERYSCWGVTVDANTFNPSRMLKVPGTAVRKGAAAPDRPHRAARVLRVPDGWPRPAAGSLPNPHVPGPDVATPAVEPRPKPAPAGKPAVRKRQPAPEPQRLFDPGPSRRPVD